MSDAQGYASPGAFRRALTDRLKEAAKDSRWTLQQMQRQMAYDRLLERLYLEDRGWILKGATALLARGLGVRATVDIDVFRHAAREMAESELRAAATRDTGDWFRFEVGPARAVADAAAGLRLPITARIGATSWAAFHVDIVGADVRMTGEPDDVPALARVGMSQIQQHGYRAYPLVDHVADKVAAIFARYGEMAAPSTRYKDLVDLVAIVTKASVEADAQLSALHSEAERRAITLPDGFDAPDRDLWQRGYAAEARRSLLQGAWTLDEALEVMRPFLNPLLGGSARGRWDPASRRWALSFTLGNERRRNVVHERVPGVDAVRARRRAGSSSGRADRPERGLDR